MTKPATTILLVSLTLIVYYGVALFCIVWGFALSTPVWMESFLYAASLSEPAAWLIRVAVLPFQRPGLKLEAVSFAFYLSIILTASFSLLVKKSWARKVILISQSLKVCFLLLYAVLTLLLQASTHMTQSLRWQMLGISGGVFFFLITPSFFIWHILTRPSIKREFL